MCESGGTADALVSGTSDFGHEGSNPSFRTNDMPVWRKWQTQWLQVPPPSGVPVRGRGPAPFDAKWRNFGRRTGMRGRRPSGREGSSPFFATNIMPDGAGARGRLCPSLAPIVTEVRFHYGVCAGRRHPLQGSRGGFESHILHQHGRLAERPKAPVSKTGGPQGSVGSNPTPTSNMDVWLRGRRRPLGKRVNRKVP